MKRVVLSPARAASAGIVAGSLFAYVGPRLAQDGKVDFKKVLAPMRKGKSFRDVKPQIIAALRAEVAGKLAQDADIEDVAALMDAVEAITCEPSAAVPTGLDPMEGDPDVEITDVDDDGEAEIVRDDEPPELMAKVREFIKDHVDDDVLAQFDQLVGGEHEPEEIPEEPLEEEEDDDMMGRDRRRHGMDNYVTKPAMDAAIALTEKRVRENERAISAAREHVAPWVGRIALACDSADEVYRAALGSLGVKYEQDWPSSALRAMLDRHPKPGSGRDDGLIAVDAKPSSASFAERFPGAARVRHVV